MALEIANENEMEQLMINPVYIGMILEFCSSLQLITTIKLLSRYHNQYINSAKHCHQLIQRTLKREFGVIVEEIKSSSSSLPSLSIQIMHNYWNDKQKLINRWNKSNFIDRIMKYYKQWTVQGLIHYISSISKQQNIPVELLSFNQISKQFEVSGLRHNHILHVLWDKTMEMMQKEADDEKNKQEEEEEEDEFDDSWMGNFDEIDENEEAQKQRDKLLSIKSELERYIMILHWMAMEKEYDIDNADVLKFYSVYEIVNYKRKREMLEMIIDAARGTNISVLFDFLFDIIEPQKPINVENLHDDFDRVWPKWSEPFVNILLPELIKFAVKSAELGEDFLDGMEIDKDTITMRWILSDIIMEIADVIGQKTIYNIFLQLLSDESVDENNWRYYEAIIFCIATHSKVAHIDASDLKQQHPLYQVHENLRWTKKRTYQ